MRIGELAWWLVGLGSVAACAATEDSTFDGDPGPVTATSSGAGANGAGGTTFATTGVGGGAGSGDGCSEAAKLVYVLSDANDLYSFAPADRQFTFIGALSCPTAMQPNSMAVDRDAVAWVNYVANDGIGDYAGSLYRVSTADATCESVPAAAMPSGWYRVGMGFSANGSSADETLFVTRISSGGGLGRIDTATGALSTVGTFTGPYSNQSAELTGTGDGGLFAFFTTSPVVVAELSKSTGDVVGDTPLPTVEVPLAWAFSFWGGDFYLYTATSGQSRVNRYRPGTGEVDTNYMTNVGFRIVGAGVSTCAPLEPPK